MNRDCGARKCLDYMRHILTHFENAKWKLWCICYIPEQNNVDTYMHMCVLDMVGACNYN